MTLADQVPDGWVVKRLSEVAHITAGGDVDPLTGSPVETDFHPHPVYANAIERSAIHSYSSVARNPAGAVTITARGTLGYAVYREKPFTAIGRLLVVWPNDRFDGRFLAQYLNARVSFAVESTGVPQLTGPQAGSYEVMLPTNLPEQQAIAAALSDADGVVAGLERVIAKKRLIKQGAMQDLLTARRRLPGFSGEWEVKKLGDLVTSVTGGGTPSRTRSELWDGPIPWMTVKDFATGAVNTTLESITAEGLKNSASRLVTAGTLILCTRMAVGKTTIMDVDVAINQDLKALSFKTGVSVSYIKRVFELLQNQIEENAGGSTVKGISIGDVRGLEFSLPPFDEQQAIAAVLSDMDAEIQTLESRLAKARAVKEGMMQNLLTGRVRLV